MLMYCTDAGQENNKTDLRRKIVVFFLTYTDLQEMCHDRHGEFVCNHLVEDYESLEISS